MDQKRRTLLFLSKNYQPFTYFSTDMIDRAGDAFRLFEIKGGEQFTLQASGGEDSLFVINGNATIRQQNQDVIQVDASQIKAQPILFSSAIEISTDSHATLCHADSALVNDYLSLKDISDSSGVKDTEALTERMMFLKSTQVFRLLPINVVEEAARRCEEILVKKDEEIIRQDTRADDFYVLLEGEAEVWREEMEDDEPQMVALLGKGASFGEEALIIGGGRNASVKMATDGILLRITQADFDELVSTPALRSVSAEVAQVMVEDGAEIIDVRYEEEYEQQFIPGSVLLPLPDLRNHMTTLDKNKEYLILCAAGLRAAAATLLLRQQDLNAVYIEGGIKAWPFETAKSLDLELILFDFCPFAQRAVSTLLHTGVPHKLTYLDPDNLPDWFAEVSPFGKVPVLRIDGKTTIFESSVINELVATVSAQNMLPTDPVERSLCRSWIEFGSTLLGQLTGMMAPEDVDTFKQSHESFLENLQRLEEQMASRGSFFTGESFSLVDSTYAPLFMRMNYLNQRMDLYQENDFPNIQAWADQLLSLESVINSVHGDFQDIYHQFIQRRGATGYLVSTMKEVA